jgi:NADH-quinone oxidoreductase subunit D
MASLPRLIRPRPGRAWAAVEGPRGMLGVYTISDGSDQPFRFRIHDPSLLNLETLPALATGHLLADTMTIIASLDPVMGGIDK